MSAYWDPLAELQLIGSYCSARIPDRAQPGKSLGLLRGFLARDQILPEAAAGQVFPIRPAIGEGSGLEAAGRLLRTKSPVHGQWSYR